MTRSAGSAFHLVHTWGGPSERFVRQAVAASGALHPIVLAEHDLTGTPGVELHSIGWRAPERVRSKLLVAQAVWRTVGRRPRLVHAHFADELELADWVARARRVPLVVSLHGYDVLVAMRGRSSAPLRRAHAVVVPSTFLAEVVQRTGVHRSSIAVIPSGVDLTEVPFRPRVPVATPCVVFIGRFVEKKGPVDAARAIVAVAAETDLRASFVGFGPLEAEVRAALRPLGDRAQVLDGRDRGTVLHHLQSADVVVTPSRTATDGDAESLHIVNLEAQASGAPLLTTDHGGIPEAVHPAAGRLVPEANVDALAAALRTLLADAPSWRAMGEAGRQWVEHGFSLERFRERTAALYESVLRSHGVPADLLPPETRPSEPGRA